MRFRRVAEIACAATFSVLCACSSNDTVVSVNLLSSNDTQYNGTTSNGSKGGLLDPGIPDNILNPKSTSTQLRKAVQLRITIKQGSTLSVTSDVAPVGVTFTTPVVDADGNPVLDAMGKPTQATHTAIAPFYKRFTLPDAWKDGSVTVTGEALDGSGTSFFDAVPTTVNLKQNEAVAAFVDFALPNPPTAVSEAGAGGADDSAAGEAGANGAIAGNGGTGGASGGSAGTAGASSGGTGGTAGRGGSSGTGG
jgi:hypothetical protein